MLDKNVEIMDAQKRNKIQTDFGKPIFIQVQQT
jgi:hypothetical protein